MARANTRQLQVFLTEYGYGLLGREARNTVEGRERQRAWFASTAAQARDLGIAGPMAFLLTPYLERNFSEFGLLMPAGSPADSSGAEPATPGLDWGGYAASPALKTLLGEGRAPWALRSWTAPPPPASSVVIDFVAGRGMLQAKSYCGYLLRGAHGGAVPGEGLVVLYNFGRAPESGELALGGDAWALGAGGSIAVLSLQPGERREIPVLVKPGQDRFEANPVKAVWRAKPGAQAVAAEVAAPPQAAGVTASKADSRGVAVRAGNQELFDVYIRATNGNLYQTWQRLWAKEGWQRYMERMGDFTMAFFGRANLPWRFADNEPAALVFFFRPEQLPVTYEIRRAQVVEYGRP